MPRYTVDRVPVTSTLFSADSADTPASREPMRAVGSTETSKGLGPPSISSPIAMTWRERRTASSTSRRVR